MAALGRITVGSTTRPDCETAPVESGKSYTLQRGQANSLISWHRLSASPSLLALASHYRDTVHPGGLQGLPLLIYKCQGHGEVATWRVGLSGSELQLLHPLLH